MLPSSAARRRLLLRGNGTAAAAIWRLCCGAAAQQEMPAGASARGLHHLAPQIPDEIRRQRWSWPAPSPPLQLTRRSMFIQTQPTPNVDAMMFIPGREIMGSGSSQDFGSARAAMVSPLAKKLFQVDGVDRVFFGSDFITVTKTSASEWAHLKPEIYGVITDFFTSGEPLIDDQETIQSSDTAIHEDDDETVAMIKELLETRIRPAIQEDGGDLVFKGFDREDGFVRLKLIGACSTCASSTVTLRNGVENMLMHYVPEVKGVEHVQDEEEMVGAEEFDKLEKTLEEKRRND